MKGERGKGEGEWRYKSMLPIPEKDRSSHLKPTDLLCRSRALDLCTAFAEFAIGPFLGREGGERGRGYRTPVQDVDYSPI